MSPRLSSSRVEGHCRDTAGTLQGHYWWGDTKDTVSGWTQEVRVKWFRNFSETFSLSGDFSVRQSKEQRFE